MRVPITLMLLLVATPLVAGADLRHVPWTEFALDGVLLGQSQKNAVDSLGVPIRVTRVPHSHGQLLFDYGRLQILFVDGVVDQISTTSTDVCTPSRICPGMSTGAVHTIYGYSPLVEHNGKTVIEYYQPETDCWLELSVREDRIESIFARCQV